MAKILINNEKTTIVELITAYIFGYALFLYHFNERRIDMANNYKGYLLKFGSQIVPNNYFCEYSSTPDQRLDSDAERDNTGYLQRSTLPSGKTSIKFSTHILHLDEKIALQNIINNSIINTVQRKCMVEFWDDETNTYKTSYFYIPDIEYVIMDADDTDITYQPISFELIEY